MCSIIKWVKFLFIVILLMFFLSNNFIFKICIIYSTFLKLLDDNFILNFISPFWIVSPRSCRYDWSPICNRIIYTRLSCLQVDVESRDRERHFQQRRNTTILIINSLLLWWRANWELVISQKKFKDRGNNMLYSQGQKEKILHWARRFRSALRADLFNSKQNKRLFV